MLSPITAASEEAHLASRAATSLFDAATIADRWIADYCAHVPDSDVLCARGRDSAWAALFEELAAVAGDGLEPCPRARPAPCRGYRHRLPHRRRGRGAPLAALACPAADRRRRMGRHRRRHRPARRIARDASCRSVWRGEAGRRRRMSPRRSGRRQPLLPAPARAGSTPPGGYHLQFVAADLCRGPDRRVARARRSSPRARRRGLCAREPAGDRAHAGRASGAAQYRAARALLRGVPRRRWRRACRRAEPRIGLLTPGRLNPSYAEQAHLARYLGFLLVEGADLAVLDDRLYVRTIAGLKRVDALWHRARSAAARSARARFAFDDRRARADRRDRRGQCRHRQRAGRRACSKRRPSPPSCRSWRSVLTRRGAQAAQYRDLVVRAGCRARRMSSANLESLLVAPGVRRRAARAARRQGDARRGAESPASARRLARRHGAPPAGLCRAGDRASLDHAGGRRGRARAAPLHAARVRRARRRGRLDRAARRLRADRRASRSARRGDGRGDVVGRRLRPRARSGRAGLAAAFGRYHPASPQSRAPCPAASPTISSGSAAISSAARRCSGVLRVLLGNSISADTGAALAADTVGAPDRAGRRRRRGARSPRALKRADLTQLARTALEDEEGWYSVRAINRQARADRRSVARPALGRHDPPARRALPARKGALLDRAGSLQRRYSALSGPRRPSIWRAPTRGASTISAAGSSARCARSARSARSAGRTRPPTICRPCSISPTARSAIASAI